MKSAKLLVARLPLLTLWAVCVLAVDDDWRHGAARLRSNISSRSVIQHKIAPVTLDDAGTPVVDLQMDLSSPTVVGAGSIETIVTVGMYVTLRWADPLLAWDPASYGGVSSVEMEADSLWTPDLRVLNTAQQTPVLQAVRTVSLNSSGHVRVHRLMVTDVLCNMDMKWFPNDKQECNVLFTSYGEHDVRIQVSLNSTAVDEVSEDIRKDNEWELLESKTAHETVWGKEHAKLMLTMERKTAFYWVCLIAPLIVSSTMADLVFMMDPSTRVGHLVSSFISISISIGALNALMPRGLDDLPLVMIVVAYVPLECLVLLFITTVLNKKRGEDEDRDALLDWGFFFFFFFVKIALILFFIIVVAY